MRRFFTIIFAVYYLAVAAGVTVHSHYCMGKLASMDFYHARKNPCACGEKGEMPGCCKHEALLLKTDAAQQTALISLPVPPEGMLGIAIGAALNIFHEWVPNVILLPLTEHCRSCKTVPFYLLFSVFRN